MPRPARQLGLDLIPQHAWGGKRPGAGRRPAGDEPCLPHRARAELDGRTPAHVTLRARRHVWNLRSRRCHRVISGALRGVSRRLDFAVVHFSVQGNHVHLIVEADTAAALGKGVRALSIRIAKGLNTLMGSRGSVFEDRYHAHVLSTPTEARRALAYVVGNFRSHAARRGSSVEPELADPYSSIGPTGIDGEAPPVAPARTWLLRQAVSTVVANLRPGEVRSSGGDRPPRRPTRRFPDQSSYDQ
jgi:putative transposase